MKKIISLILLTSSLIYAQNLEFSKKDIQIINDSSKKKFILHRIKKYYSLRDKIKEYKTIRKLAHINSFYNRIFPQEDTQKYGISDYWSTRKEFLINGNGDCEDYVIAKYLSLLEVGIPKEKLFLSVVRLPNKETYHMILFYFETINSIPLVLDNMNYKVLELNKREKFEIKFIFNEKESYNMKDNKIFKKVKINWGKDNKWADLLSRVYDKKE